MHAWFNKHWYTNTIPLWWLKPFELIYLWIVKQRAKKRKLLPKEDHPIVIVVGNITVGGTGKTPMILWLTKYLQEHGKTVVVISRGYRSKAPTYPWLVTSDQQASQVGDEPLLIAKQTEVPVIIDPRRSRACDVARKLQPHVIISDDGMQHYALARHYEIAMVDALRGFGNQRALPVGPLREPMSRLGLVDAVIHTRIDNVDDNSAFFITLKPKCWINVRSGLQKNLDHWSIGTEVNAVAGIGHPERFFNMLRSLGLSVESYNINDHQFFTAQDLKLKHSDAPLIMTEKDALRVQDSAMENWWYLQVVAQPNESLVQWVDDQFVLGH